MSLITVLRIRSNSPHFCRIGIIFVGFGSFLLDLVHFCWIYIIFVGFASFCWNCINFVEFHIIEDRFGSDPNLTKESPHCSYDIVETWFLSQFHLFLNALLKTYITRTQFQLRFTKNVLVHKYCTCTWSSTFQMKFINI